MASAKPNASEGSAAEYTVLARRYRPSQFDDCVGQEHVARALRNAIEQNRVAHAYLFTGARGVGKTSMARIFAKALNCMNGPTVQPCGVCDACVGIAAGEDLDVLEIDGASNRGIDEVRELRQGVNYRPSRSRFKIYIIDEVHMLTREAFNALLKTLEEPPAHAKFIFATTEPQKIPITILSRCQRFDFSGIEFSRIVTRLRQIVESEGVSAEEEALAIVARRAGGSMRDSQSLLDQLLAFAGERLTADDVYRLTGTANDERVAALAGAILNQDAAGCLRMVEEAIGQGAQLGDWVEQLLDFFRDLLVLGIDGQAPLVSASDRRREEMQASAARLPTERALEMMDLLATCRARMKTSGFARTLLEMTLVRLCRLDQFLNLEQAVASGPPASAPRTGPTVAAPPAPLKKNESNGVSPAPTFVHASPESPAAIEPTAPATMPLSAENLGAFWSALLRAIPDMILTGMLEKSHEQRLPTPSLLMVRFPAPLSNSKRYCEEGARLERLEKACSELAGRPVALRFELDAAVADDPVAKPPPMMELRHRAAEHPLVRRAEATLGAKILSVDQIAPKPTGPMRIDDPESETP